MSVTLIKAAWDHPPTVVGYKRLALRRLGWVLSLGGPPVTALACIGLVPHAGLAFALMTMLAAPLFPWVVIAYFRRRRVVAVLQAYPWRELQCQHQRRPPGSPATVAIPFPESNTALFRIIPLPVPLATLEDDHPDRIWFAGDPASAGSYRPSAGTTPCASCPTRRAGRSAVARGSSLRGGWGWCGAVERRRAPDQRRRGRRARRSDSERPPQTPKRSSLDRAYSRHAARPSHAPHSRFASRSEEPGSGKKKPGPSGRRGRARTKRCQWLR